MINLQEKEIWFLTGSQHLYGSETLQQVDEHSKVIADYLDVHTSIPTKVVFKPVLTTPEAIYNCIAAANATTNCVGIITWMHTFSPTKMWIRGLNILDKPMLHFHTQFNRDIPWGDIDMDFMNLNQSAHGGREFGFICARMGIKRKIVVGHWKDEEAINEIAVWSRVAVAWDDMRGAKFARFGDNMRQVGVTEGNKVSAEIQFGFSVNTYGVGDLVDVVNQISDSEINALLEEYETKYILQDSLKKGGDRRDSLVEGVRIEAGLRKFLTDGGFKGMTDTFEDLHGLKQLPGAAIQRLMAEGFGFGGEGDWKTAALTRAVKVMGLGLEGGSSFMEDYTYHFDPANPAVLGAHMLEIDESIAGEKPKCEVHPLGIGGKEDPVRLVFNAGSGEAINASLIDLGDHFKLLVNEVKAIEIPHDMPNLPVARVLWTPYPDMKTGIKEWIKEGGAHHTAYSTQITAEYMEDFAEMSGLKYVLIGK